MSTPIDLTGQRFTKLVAQEHVGSNKHGGNLWRCVCDCKNEVIVGRSSLRTGNTKSCGCLKSIPNKIEHLADGIRILTLQHRNGSLFQCFLDTEDCDKIQAHQWRVLQSKGKHTCYAVMSVQKPDGSKSNLLMHRFLLPGNPQVDHVDRNGLNNRKKNLRPATQSLNNANRRKSSAGRTSQYRGVSLNKKSGGFVANITVNDKQMYLGYFDSEEAAAIMYNIFAKRAFGPFANLNVFPEPATEPIAA